MSHHHHVWVFFYGSYMSLDVLAEVELTPSHVEPAQLPRFDLVIAPRANLVPDQRATAYGALVTATHDELSRLYDDHALGTLGERYLPEAVLTVDAEGRHRPALTYLAHDMAARPADRAYVERIVGPAQQLGFPSWYIDKILSFAPRSDSD